MSSYDQDFGQPVTIRQGQRTLDQAALEVPAWEVPLVAPPIEALRPYAPGRPYGEIAKEVGVAEDTLLRLAANENVIGPSPKAVEAATTALLRANYYPDGGANALRAGLADRLSVAKDRIVVGNGSNEIIELLIRTFVTEGETVVTAWPSFVVYRLASQAHGRDVLVAPLSDHRYDLYTLASLVDYRTKLCFIANPNNPTGTYVSRSELETFLDRIPQSVIVVLDEAYFEYADADDYPNGLIDFPGRARIVVLRTFSKAYGLAGLRVGYGVMDADLADYLHRVRQPYNLNAVAQAAALAALSDDAHLEKSRAAVISGKKQLAAGLDGLGLSFIESQANFMVIFTPGRAEEVQQAFHQRGILIRSMDGYGMPDAVRITVGTEAMNVKVLETLEAVLGAKAK